MADAEEVWGTVFARERGMLPEQTEIARLKAENAALVKALKDCLTPLIMCAEKYQADGQPQTMGEILKV